MTRNQFNHTEMFQTVVSYLIQHQAVWEGSKAAQAAVTALQDRNALILEKLGQQHAPTSGRTGEKGQLRERFTLFILEMAGQLRAVADITENVPLAAETRLAPSELNRLAGDDLQSLADRILELMNTHLEALADFGVSSKEVTTMESFIAQFQETKSAPRRAVTGRKLETRTLPGLIRETTRWLRNRVDQVMLRYRTTHPDFHVGYLFARDIVERGGGRRQKTSPNIPNTPVLPSTEPKSQP